MPGWSASPTRAPKELGFADIGALWRSGYDMTPDEFAAQTDRLWSRSSRSTISCTAMCAPKLNEKYGDAVQPKTGPIRADLLGNMWAQEWGNIYDDRRARRARRRRLSTSTTC